MNKIELENLVNNGYSVRRLADFFNCSIGNIQYWLKVYGLKTKPIKTYWKSKRILDVFGKSKCIICKRDDKTIVLHEIHGKKHPITETYYIQHKTDFVWLCLRCHKALGFLSKNVLLAIDLLKQLQL